MKLTTLFAAAGMLIASLGVSASADAQPRGDRYEQRGDGPRLDRGRDGRRYDRQDRRRYDRDDRRRYRDGRYRNRDRYGSNQRRCRPEWRNGRRIQICG